MHNRLFATCVQDDEYHLQGILGRLLFNIRAFIVINKRLNSVDCFYDVCIYWVKPVIGQSLCASHTRVQKLQVLTLYWLVIHFFG